MASRRVRPGSPPRASAHLLDGRPITPQTSGNMLKARDPPPTLFLHPSPAASHASLPGPGVASPGQNHPSHRHHADGGTGPSGGLAIKPVLTTSLAPGPAPGRIPLQSADSSRSVDRTDALWAEMQATLEEVEVSASGGTHVFGPDHDRKLAELRAAQILLAQSWARSEADEAIETREGGGSTAGGTAAAAAVAAAAEDEMRPLKGTVLGEAAAKSVKGDSTAGAGPGTEARSTAAGTASVPRPGSSGGGGAERLGAKLEEETKVDILLARRRREANDRYFDRVNRGVLDVVAKLEHVAAAMREVERESKELWNEHGSVAGSAKSS